MNLYKLHFSPNSGFELHIYEAEEKNKTLCFIDGDYGEKRLKKEKLGIIDSKMLPYIMSYFVYFTDKERTQFYMDMIRKRIREIIEGLQNSIKKAEYEMRKDSFNIIVERSEI